MARWVPLAGRCLLVLDEPFGGLAPALARRLGEVLSNLKGEGVSVLMSELNETLTSSIFSIAPFASSAAR